VNSPLSVDAILTAQLNRLSTKLEFNRNDALHFSLAYAGNQQRQIITLLARHEVLNIAYNGLDKKRSVQMPILPQGLH
jgi:hypothetical protein